MQSATRNRRRALLAVAQPVALLAVFYLYVWLRIRPELFYVQDSLVFLFDVDFFHGFLDRPGGLVEYASAFLSPLFVYGWLGALVVTLLTLVICLATRQFLLAVAGVGGRVLFLIPALLVLLVLGQYCHPVELCVGLCVALVFANVYVRIGGSHLLVRLALFAIASLLVYYLAAGLYVVFACLCGFFELGGKRRLGLGTLCLLGAVAVPMAASAWPFDLSMSQAYRGLWVREARHWLGIPSSMPVALTLQIVLLLFFLVVPMIALWRRRRQGTPVDARGASPDSDPSVEPAVVSDGQFRGARVAVAWIALLVLAVVGDVVSFDFPKKCLLKIEESAAEREWTDVLTHARRLPPSDMGAMDPRIASHVNRALYFEGDLLDRMFAYPQALSTPSLALVYESATAMAELTPWQCSEVFFDLGRVNESHHMAYEALEFLGDRPGILKRLVDTHLIRGEPEPAKRFLARLERSMLHRRWARRLRRELDADPALSGMAAIASRRELTVTRDSICDVASLERMLVGLLEQEPRNRMAFEYLMAHYLLTRQLDKLAAHLHRLDDFDYPRIPRHCEEGLAIYLATTGSEDFDLGQREIDPETWRRFEQFMLVEREARGDVSAAFAALYPEFGDSYFFCYVFGHNSPAHQQSRPSR